MVVELHGLDKRLFGWMVMGGSVTDKGWQTE